MDTAVEPQTQTTQPSLADNFIQHMIKSHELVSIFMLNGIQLKGYLSAFDKHAILLQGRGWQLIYKHAISTIMPVSG